MRSLLSAGVCWGALAIIGCGSSTGDSPTAPSCGDATVGEDSTTSAETGLPATDSSISDSITPTDTTSGVDSDVSDSTRVPDAPLDSIGDATSCPTKPGGVVCNSVPKFTGKQVVDGSGDEFCDVPATILVLKKGVVPSSWGAPGPVPDVLTARIAWDALGIHAHLHVDDPVLVVGADGSGSGPDYIEFDIGGDAPTYGFYDGVSYDDGFMQLLLQPAGPNPGFKNLGPSTAPKALMRYMGKDSGTGVARPVVFSLQAPAAWASRVVAGGYEFELYFPWSVLGRASAPAAGAQIAVDLGLSTCNDPKAWAAFGTGSNPYNVACEAKYQGNSFLAIKPLPSGKTPACGSPESSAGPYCDDRMWCAPTLE